MEGISALPLKYLPILSIPVAAVGKTHLGLHIVSILIDVVNSPQNPHFEPCPKFGLNVASLTAFGGLRGGLTHGCILSGTIFPSGITKP